MTKKERDKMLLEGCESGDFNKVRLAINFGADLEAKDKDGWTPLHMASERNYIEIAELLIEMGADVEAKDDKGWTPLHRASANNHIETAKLLLNWGVDTWAKCKDGDIPYEKSYTDEMKELLIQYMK